MPPPDLSPHTTPHHTTPHTTRPHHTTPHHVLLAACCSPLTAHRSSLTAHRLPLTAHCSLLTAPCSLLAVHSLLLTAHGYCSLLTTYSSLSIEHCSPSPARGHQLCRIRPPPSTARAPQLPVSQGGIKCTRTAPAIRTMYMTRYSCVLLPAACVTACRVAPWNWPLPWKLIHHCCSPRPLEPRPANFWLRTLLHYVLLLPMSRSLLTPRYSLPATRPIHSPPTALGTPPHSTQAYPHPIPPRRAHLTTWTGRRKA